MLSVNTPATTTVRRVRFRSTMCVPPCECGVKPEPAHARLAARVHEDERDHERAQEHLDDGEDLKPRHRAARVAAAICVDSVADDARERIQKLLVTGDNRLKQGVAPEKVRETYEEALAVARRPGLEDAIRPLVEVRLADLERLARESPPPVPPAA